MASWNELRTCSRTDFFVSSFLIEFGSLLSFKMNSKMNPFERSWICPGGLGAALGTLRSPKSQNDRFGRSIFFFGKIRDTTSLVRSLAPMLCGRQRPCLYVSYNLYSAESLVTVTNPCETKAARGNEPFAEKRPAVFVMPLPG